MRVVLYSPQIPQNTGNIARTCALTGARLTLVRPLGFSLSKRHLKRAGLDYWDEVEIDVVDTLEEVLHPPFYFLSTKGKQLYTQAQYEEGSTLVFGSETDGLPQWVHEKYGSRSLKIPMREGLRSLNLSNACAIVLYEALRQQGFPKLILPA